jgi:hypothetical protein
MRDSNGEKKILKHTLWTILWGLIIGSYAWTAWAFQKVGEEVIANERNNIDCHVQIQRDFTQKFDGMIKEYIIPMSREVSRISARMP